MNSKSSFKWPTPPADKPLLDRVLENETVQQIGTCAKAGAVYGTFFGVIILIGGAASAVARSFR